MIQEREHEHEQEEEEEEEEERLRRRPLSGLSPSSCPLMHYFHNIP